LALIQSGDRPARYGRSRCFDTRPSKPMLQAARNRSGPISPCSKGAMKMPSGRRESSSARLVLCRLKGRGRQAGTRETRTYISSAPLDIDRIAAAIRGHWGVESMHWILDVQFKDDLSRYRQGHGAKNMAAVRRFALDLVRGHKAKGSVKTRRLIATWSPEFLLKVLSL
jgi:predicted transposase YbfD/YdcC